jgi:hypothetical protein
VSVNGASAWQDCAPTLWSQFGGAMFVMLAHAHARQHHARRRPGGVRNRLPGRRCDHARGMDGTRP